MHASVRHIVLVFAILISLHFILSFTHEGYGRITSVSSISSHLGYPVLHAPAIPNDDYLPQSNQTLPSYPNSTDVGAGRVKANATFVILARNTELEDVVKSMRDVEDRFNRKLEYPWTMLNEVPFTEEFKKRVSVITRAPIEFGLIPHDDWFQPSWIDEEKAQESRNEMVEDNIIYGGSFFFRHELLQKYRYYWRVEPDVHFHCDIDFDPFLFMQKHGKTYGFTITMYEYHATIPTLWETVKDFTTQHPEYIAKDNAMGFISEDNGDTFNLCHFWSNFEIADMDFWRGEAYTAFFDFLDKTGGFYYERWGDAPVHSLAAALFLPKDQIHFFDEIGYEHSPYTHCPQEGKWEKGRCSCDTQKSFDYDGYSCMKKWDRLMGY